MKLLNYLEKNKTYIIAEMSGNHGGSLEHALEIVRAAAEAGADCLKIQTYTADTMTIDSKTDPFLVHSGLWENEYLYDLYKKAFTPWEWTAAIKEETERLGMDFLSTPFDLTAVDFLEEHKIEFYKIASFEVVDIPLIRKVAKTGKPVVMSCGMASEEEIKEAVDAIKAEGNEKIFLLKCCSAYPADYSNMNLCMIPNMKEKFQVHVGLSDHSAGSLACVMAVAMGACVIEKHICISREDKTVDSDFSMDKDEFAQMVKDVRNAERSRGKISYGPSEDEMQSYAHRRSLFVTKDICKGERFTKENIKSIRPACGLHTRYYDTLLENKCASRDLAFGTPLSLEDVEGGI